MARLNDLIGSSPDEEEILALSRCLSSLDGRENRYGRSLLRERSRGPLLGVPLNRIPFVAAWDETAAPQAFVL